MPHWYNEYKDNRRNRRQQSVHKPDASEPDEADTELVPRSDPRSAIISIDPQRMSGTPCFVGTRVPIKNLWDYLEGGDSPPEFLDGFPGVSREQAVEARHTAFQKLSGGS